ncbi:unnamed protein product [Malus baccata var. baccata]
MAQQASSSHSTSSSSWCSYDVFLSFRGEDTRKTFTDHLYTAFVNANFRTFRDNDELERGEDIKPGFKRAIQQSRSSVVVFSKDYASSKWCLNELVMILKLKKTSDHVVLPVFYDVDPSHLRKQTGSLAKAFSKHQKVQSFDTVKEWREALAEAADLAGMVLQNEEDGYGTKKIEGLILNMQMHPAYARLRNSNDQIVLETNGFAQMHKLKLLQLSYVQLNGCYKEFSTGLRWLCWFKFPFDSLPSNFPLESLVALEMCCSSLREVWKETELLPSLKILNLSHSRDLTKTPDFSFVPKLERLILKSCESLIHVDESIGNLEGLVHLNMEDCKSITKLPRNISMLTSLETLIISGCSNLSMFSLDMREMESLKVFEADGVPVHRLLTSAEELTLCPRPNVEISRASYLPRNLVDLRLSNCNLSNDDFPRELGSLSSLKILDLDSNPICSLPDCVRGITGLDSLSFYNCTRLKSLVRLPTVGNLSILGCKALEKVTFQSFSQVDSRMRCIGYTGIRKVDEVLEYECWYKIEPIEIVDMEMINLLGLGNLKYSTESFVMSQYLRLAFGWRAARRPIQGLQECGIFSTFLPGSEA